MRTRIDRADHQVSSSRVDVILPIRPEPPRLKQVLTSLNDQTYENWSLIALLDRDRGGNRKVIEDTVTKHKVTYIDCDYREEGFPAMLNKGLLAATADHVARQDDDDISTSQRFMKQVEILESDVSTILVTGHASVIDSSGKGLSLIQQPTNPRDIAQALTARNIIPHSSVMIRRNELLNCGGYDESMRGCEDYDLWLRMLQVGKIRTVGTTVLEILHHPGGMSRQAMTLEVITQLNKRRREACRHLGMSYLSYLSRSLWWSVGQLAAPRLTSFGSNE